MDIISLLTAVISGIVVGGFVLGTVNSLIALGLSMLWATVDLPNFSHGSLLVLGAYVAWYFYTITGNPLALASALPFLFLVGVLSDRVVFKKIRGKSDAALRLMLVTLTLGIIIEQALNLTFGGVNRKIPSLIQGGAIIGGASITNNQMLASAISIAALIVMYLFLTRTKVGLAIRAVGQSTDESSIVGVNVERIYTLTVAVGFALAGVAGLLLGSLFLFNPASGRGPLLTAFITVVLGGLGNVKGTIYAAFLVAIIEALTIFFIGGGASLTIPFVVMIIILAIRPYGLFGSKVETT